MATLQLEVAQRLMAQADDDDYGVLTLLVQLDYEPRDWFKIPADCFFPAPDVDSACVVLVRRARPLLADGQRAAFVKIVKRAFSQRRKMMLKLLKQDWPVEKLAAAFAELKISPQERAEKLSLEQFVALTIFHQKECYEKIGNPQVDLSDQHHAYYVLTSGSDMSQFSATQTSPPTLKQTYCSGMLC